MLRVDTKSELRVRGRVLALAITSRRSTQYQGANDLVNELVILDPKGIPSVAVGYPTTIPVQTLGYPNGIPGGSWDRSGIEFRKSFRFRDLVKNGIFASMLSVVRYN
jgi:hypothetical protein